MSRKSKYPQWLRDAASKGGTTSRRKLTREQAQAMHAASRAAIRAKQRQQTKKSK